MLRKIARSIRRFFVSVSVAGVDRTAWHKRPLGVFLLYCFTILLAFWNKTIPPSGYAVAGLAVAAAVMALRGEMGGKEKVAWIFILFGFLWVELTSIDEKDKAQTDIQNIARAQQLEHFREIGDGIRASMAQSDRNFAATMGRTNQVLQNLTGGESYPEIVVIPATGEPSGDMRFAFSVNGSSPLYEVSYKVISGRPPYLPTKESMAEALAGIGWTHLGELHPKVIRPLNEIVHPSAKEDNA